MQLRIQRSQRAGGVVSTIIFFCLDVRADYSPEEQSNIGKYKLGGEPIYNSAAAKKHLDSAGTQLERTQSGTVGERFAGLARGSMSLVMAKLNLNITIASLGRGHHIECKDLEELLEAEDTVRTACKNVTRYLEVARTFDGSEVVIEYVNGEEQVHITEHAPPMLDYAAPESVPSQYGATASSYEAPLDVVMRHLRGYWNDSQTRKFLLFGAGLIALILLLRSCA